MTSSEASRHSLYARLQEVLGPEHADTLMTSLPIDRGAELATKSDIEMLRAEVKEIRTLMLGQQRTYMATTVGAMTALTAIFGVIVSIVV